MTRSFYAVIALAFGVAVTALSCNPVKCGAGTKQVQAADGTLSCEFVDDTAANIPCDSGDGGTAIIVGGKCISRLMCGQDSTPIEQDGKIYCQGTGGSSCPSCPAVQAGKICVSGRLFNLTTGKFLDPGERTVRVRAYEPLGFLSDPNATPLGESEDDKGCYAFTLSAKPSTDLLAVATSDAAGTTTQVLQLTAAGAKVAAGTNYAIDVPVVTHQQVVDWSTASGTDWDAQGAYVGCFFDEGVKAANDFKFSETKPVSGVQLVVSGSVSAKAKYFGADLLTIGTGTSTSAVGCAINPTPDNLPDVFLGQGGTCSDGKGGTAACQWENHPGGTTAHLVFVDRFHNCLLSPTATSCQQ